MHDPIFPHVQFQQEYELASHGTEVGREFLMYFGFWDFLALDNVFMPN